MVLSRWWVAGSLAAMALSACGGGGGDGGSSTRAALPALAQDINPSGDRVDYRDRNYFPMAVGDHWTYDLQQGGVSIGQTLTRTVSAGAGADVVISEVLPGTTGSTSYRRTAEGIVEVLPLAGVAPDSVSQFVGDLLEYPEPFYAVGSTRRFIRQGSWGADLDGDGVAESYHLEITQIVVGFETLFLAGAPRTDVAHFRNIVSLTVQPSAVKNDAQTVTGTEEAWWAPNIGLVRAERTAVDSSGAAVLPAYAIVLTGGSVAGTALLAP